jgi:hypothetical protein
MKKRIVAALIAVFALGIVSGTALSATGEFWNGYKTVRIVSNGKEIQGDVPAIIVHDRTMIPLRNLSEAVGMKVVWDGTNYIVYLEGNPVAK